MINAKREFKGNLKSVSSFHQIHSKFIFYIILAGRTTTNEELEEMLESNNPAIFTQGVSYVLFKQN